MKKTVFVVLFFVVGCGGGSEDSESGLEPIEPEVVEEIVPPPRPSCPEGQAGTPPNCSTPPPPQEPESLVSTCDPAEVEEITEEELDAFIESMGETPPEDALAPWESSPTLLVGGDASEREDELIDEAVRRINNILPNEYDIVRVADREPYLERFVFDPKTGTYRIKPDNNYGGGGKALHITLDFPPQVAWNANWPNGPNGHASIAQVEGHTTQSIVWIRQTGERTGSYAETDNWTLYLLMQNLLHSLGVWSHPDFNYRTQSVLSDASLTLPDSIPGILDCALLQKMYLESESE